MSLVRKRLPPVVAIIPLLMSSNEWCIKVYRGLLDWHSCSDH